MKRFSLACLWVGVFAFGWGQESRAHLGDVNTIFEGKAGPYDTRVIIRPPGVVPGLAEITVRILDRAKRGDLDISSVKVKPIKFDAGEEGSPPADLAVRVGGDEPLYTSELWLMNYGSYSVQVEVIGAQGSGVVHVPINSIATNIPTMSLGLKVILGILALLLFCGSVSIVGAGIREGTLPPGEQPSKKDKKWALIAMAGTTLFLVFDLWVGNSWWNQVAARYNWRLFRPLRVENSVRTGLTNKVLRLEIDEKQWKQRRLAPLIPDHGKMMHMFVISKPNFKYFSHIHPSVVKGKAHTFDVVLPPFPEGPYLVLGDITHEDGFSQTLLASAEIPKTKSDKRTEADALKSDPDDSWHKGDGLGTRPGEGSLSRDAHDLSYSLSKGRTMIWKGGYRVFRTGEELPLHFQILDAQKQPAMLELYMGMMSHGAILKKDESIFVHMHPTGTISMAAQMRYQAMSGGDMADASVMDHSKMDHSKTAGMVEGGPDRGHVENPLQDMGLVKYPPFEFLEPGLYRMWIQVKVDGQVSTAQFDILVE